MNSKFLAWDIRDLAKAAVLAGIAVATQGLITILDAGHLPTLADLKQEGTVAAIAAASYLLKNLFTNSEGSFAKKDN